MIRAVNPNQYSANSNPVVVNIKPHLGIDNPRAVVTGKVHFHGGDALVRIEFAHMWSVFQHFGGVPSGRILPLRRVFSFIIGTNA